ncbi:class I SAM-dependent methyltransferase [Sphingomonas kyungheensis]|uniref:Class I SAM-dependent methyltransferase n=1 Tax=Sphingomonas kyungheensis TaxID=1069987 RepID=A0ABU8H469_9SPHN
MTTDHSNGWEAVSDRFVAIRSPVGAALVVGWAKDHLPRSAAILDIGCGSGMPIGTALTVEGFSIWGVDASPSLIAAFHRNLPGMPAVCEPAEGSAFFARRFVGIVSIGLIFLLDAADQRRLLANVAQALEAGGRFLFSAPREACRWKDSLTGRVSVSLGADAYAAHLDSIGLRLAGCLSDEGGNHYYDVVTRI